MKLQSNDYTLPEFDNLFDFYKHIHANPPLHKDFDIREINPAVIGSYDFVAQPFRHRFYCIALYLEGDVTLNTGYWKTKLERPALYFKTPYQILSWAKPEKWLKEYFLVFTESFALTYKPLVDIIFQLPFFRMEKTIPFEVSRDDAAMLTDLYKKIHAEYRSDSEDKFDLIFSYTLTLLFHVKRLYNQYVVTDKTLLAAIKKDENNLVTRFNSIVRKSIATKEVTKSAHSVGYYADLLATHPNHLNAVVKRKTNDTALSVIHQQLLIEAKSLLMQTSLPIKEVARRLGFNEPSHFNNFFKKQTNVTPVKYRTSQ